MNTQTMQQSDIVHQVGEPCVRYRFAAEGEHKRPSAVRMNIRRRLAEVFDEVFLPVFYSHGLSFRCQCL